MHQEDKKEEPKLTPLLLADTFLNVFEAGDPGTLEHKVMEAQQ